MSHHQKMVGAQLQTEHRQNCPFINGHVKMPVYKRGKPVYKLAENKIGHSVHLNDLKAVDVFGVVLGVVVSVVIMYHKYSRID